MPPDSLLRERPLAAGVESPASEAEAAAIVRDARSRGATLALRGGGTRVGYGRAVAADAVLSSVALSGITLHEPAELVISAKAGTPLRLVEETLAAAGQILPFEPCDWRALYGTRGEPTIGGVVATNASGPRRVAAGAARDHLIGVRFVNGEGDVVKSGGRVMKNVTGLDLVKLQAGALGTLGFLTEVTFKVLPRAPATGTLVFRGLDDARGVALMTAALGSPFEVSAAAHLPPGVEAAGARTLLRLETFAESLRYRAGRLRELLRRYGEAELVEGEAAWDLWARLRDVQPFAGGGEAVWRVSVAPTRGPQVVSRLMGRLAFRHFYDWAGGLVWLATEPDGDAGAALVRAVVGETGGHATLMRGPDSLRAVVPVFQPPSAPLAALASRIKLSTDPDRILNRGRMYPDA